MVSLSLARVLTLSVAFCGSAQTACLAPGGFASPAIQNALTNGGAGAKVLLCQKAKYIVPYGLNFTAPNQEVSTEGYPTDPSLKATIAARINAVGKDGAKLLNVVVSVGSTAASAIALGGAVTNQTVSAISTNGADVCVDISPDAGKLCSGVKVTNSFFNFCPTAAISVNCKNSVIQGNTITNTKNVGIAILGAPGSQITGNTISTFSGPSNRAGITLTAQGSFGTFANVVVSGNTIKSVQSGVFNVGIAVGSRVLAPNAAAYLSGPASIVNNIFVGNIPFSIVVNGWTNGLTITGNNVAGVLNPSSQTADISRCTSPQIINSFKASQKLIAYQSAITGPKTLQSDFTSAAQDANDWSCLSPRNSKILQPNVRYGAGTVADLYGANNDNPHGYVVELQVGDGNLVGYTVATDGTRTVAWATNSYSQGNACRSSSTCYLVFQSDGNAVVYDSNGKVVWTSNTAGRGTQAVIFPNSPYFVVNDASGNVLWSAIGPF